MRTAIFPGSFDPVTKGHEDVVRRAVPLFDRIVVAVGRHSSKSSMFSVSHRLEMLAATFEDCPSIDVDSYDGLTADFAKTQGATFLLRGVRNGVDLSYEKTFSQMTRAMHPELDTVILLTDPKHSAVHSTVVRDILHHGGDVSMFVPKAVLPWLNP